MRSARKWKKDLQSVDFPSVEKLSDENILDLIYTDVPRRQELLRWLALQISDESQTSSPLGQNSKEDLAKFFCEYGLLKKSNAEDFIHARGTEKEQKYNWKVLFSYTRMRKFFFKKKLAGQQKDKKKKKTESHETKKILQIYQNDSEPDEKEKQLKEEIEEVRKEIAKREKSEPSQKIDYIEEVSQMTFRTEAIKASEEVAVTVKPAPPVPSFETSRYRPVFKPMFSEVNIQELIDELRANVSEPDPRTVSSITMREEGPPMKGDVFPRLYVFPGGPPLGKLDDDPTKYKIKLEVGAPPLNMEGEPHFDHSLWHYETYKIPKI